MGLRRGAGFGTRPIMKLAQLLSQLKTLEAEPRAHRTAGKEGQWLETIVLLPHIPKSLQREKSLLPN